MKRLRWNGLLCVLLTCVAVTACQSVERNGLGAPDRIMPGVTNREQVYQALGPPLSVYDRADRSGQTLVYSHARVNGIDLGFRFMVFGFSLAESRSATASLFVDLSRDDVVSRVRRFGVPVAPGWSLWPF